MLSQFSAGTPIWAKYPLTPLTYSQLSNPFGVTSQVAFTNLLGSQILLGVKMKCRQAFAAPGLATCTAAIGTVATLGKYAPAFDIMQAVGPTIMQVSGGTWSESSASFPVVIDVVGTGANLAFTAGLLDIWFCLASASL